MHPPVQPHQSIGRVLHMGSHVHLPRWAVVGRMTSFNWALIRDAQHLDCHMATSLQRISVKAEADK